ncbi:unnamed protein product [Caenorhabditis sp. 36 PRJEB53466]|nr:unnamed protein product [Caenorhabditis sp. 36 PRJEB53466]
MKALKSLRWPKMLKKLFHLLKKDVLLTWRSKTWTIFEIVLPLLLIIGPAVMVKLLMNRIGEQLAAISQQPDFQKDIYSPFVYVDGCGVHAAKVKNYMAESELQYHKGNVFAWERGDRGKMIRRIRVEQCGNYTHVAYNVESDMSSTLVMPLVGRHTKKTYMFLGYQYMMNKILFGLIHRLQQHGLEFEQVYTNSLDTSKLPAWSDRQVPNFDHKLFTLPRPDFPPISSLIILAFPYIYAVCMALPVISMTRNVLVEKETVKPYLTAIGLPTWLFYVEHFIFGICKSTLLITTLSLIWVYMVKNFPGVVIVGIFAYTLNSISFAILVSTVFPSSKRAVEGMVLVWMGSLGFSILYPIRGPGAMTWILSLNANHAFATFIKAVTYRAGPDGISFGELFSTKSRDLQCAAVYLFFMIFNAIWQLLAAIFIEKAVETLHLFIMRTFWNRLSKLQLCSKMRVKLKFWKKRTTAGNADHKRGTGGTGTILNCEQLVEGRSKARADVELNGLVKMFANGEKAVNGLTLRAVRGQVSVLLGHNGCGKSTTFGMITGMCKATEGKVLITGIDAHLKRSETRKCIGYCPQTNPLYEKLTVMEHLELINAIKGAAPERFRAEADNILWQIGLYDQRKMLAKRLSGGMRRKLAVCMAMIGGSRVILLDEPTAGMDPRARQDVQMMLTRLKRDRTILVTTHFMDEAERIGDWVFVMSHGRMAAAGSVHFLKQKFGEGMEMSMVLRSAATVELKEQRTIALKVCQTFIRTAKVKDERGETLEIIVPEAEKPKLAALLKCLEAISEKNFWSPHLEPLGAELKGTVQRLELLTIGISTSSLEHVFVRIGDECDAILDGLKDRKEAHRTRFENLVHLKRQKPYHFVLVFAMKCVALLEKRLYYLYRNITQILIQFVLPMAVLWYFAVMFFNLKEDAAVKNMIEIESLDLSVYPYSTVIVQQQLTNDTRLMDYLTTFDNLQIIETDYSLNVSELVAEHSAGLQRLGFIIKVSNETEVSIYYNDESPKNAAILINLLATCMYLKLGPDLQFSTDLPHISSRVIWVLNQLRAGNNVFMDVLTWMILFATILAGAVIQSVVFVSEERLARFTHQQTLTGLNSATYWAVTFFFDLITYSVIVSFTMAFVIEYGAFETRELEIVLLLYSLFFCLIPLVYIVSTLIDSPAKGSFLLYMYCTVPYILFLVSWIVLTSTNKDSYKKWSQMAFRAFNPTIAMILGVMKVAAVSYGNSLKVVYRMADVWQFDGLIIELIFMASFSLFFTVILCVLTNRRVRRCCYWCTHCKPKPRSRFHYKELEACAAVNDEEALIAKLDQKQKIVVIENLTKDFGKTRALNAFSVAIAHEECFGLLGANGAGKTTAFDIITGLKQASGGKVIVDGKNIKKRINVGYCPQFDALLDQISGRQTLRIMARLQGYRNINKIVELVLECIGMKRHGDKMIKNCSGGQKRKLSVAVALISRAKCVVLDEPTAGIDPRARREIWDILHAIRVQCRSSILLTSHSMEECEALCTRIGVLRHGEMIAVGTSQALKSQYSNHFVMTFTLRGEVDREAVCTTVLAEMPHAELKTSDTSLGLNLVWELPRLKTDKWSTKYGEVEALAKKAQVADYLLTQASLEDTFIRLNTAV